MSIDLSDPSVVSVREAFTSASSPLTWYVAGSVPSSQV